MSDELSPAVLSPWLESLLPEALGWLERMVAINSFTTNPDGVNRLGVLTAESFAGLGFEAEQVRSHVPNYGSHLYLQRGPHDLIARFGRPRKVSNLPVDIEQERVRQMPDILEPPLRTARLILACDHAATQSKQDCRARRQAVPVPPYELLRSVTDRVRPRLHRPVCLRPFDVLRKLPH